MKISIVTPLFNEEESVAPFLRELRSVLKKTGLAYQVVAIDDGSTDKTYDEMSAFSSRFPELLIIRFSRNFGQTAALSAGLKHAEGEVIITIDSDLENDPHDINKLVDKIKEGFDVVSGWRKSRWEGHTFSRKIPSLVANWLISKIGGVPLHDYGCTLKAYRRSVIEGLSLYGDMHRFIPIYVHGRGARITEIPVAHRSRRFGKSKYGISRTFRVLLDLFFIKFFTGYLNRPIHFFGGIGLICLLLGTIAGVWSIALKILALRTFVSTPLPTFAALFLIIGVQLIIMGILAEMMMRTYYESQQKTPYVIREKISQGRIVES